MALHPRIVEQHDVPRVSTEGAVIPMLHRLMWLASVTALVTAPVQAQGTPASAPIVGTWLLESIVDTLANGSLSYWMGPHPSGAIIYSASGHMSVQFMRDPRPVLPGGAA